MNQGSPDAARTAASRAPSFTATGTASAGAPGDVGEAEQLAEAGIRAVEGGDGEEGPGREPRQPLELRCLHALRQPEGLVMLPGRKHEPRRAELVAVQDRVLIGEYEHAARGRIECRRRRLEGLAGEPGVGRRRQCTVRGRSRRDRRDRHRSAHREKPGDERAPRHRGTTNEIPDPVEHMTSPWERPPAPSAASAPLTRDGRRCNVDARRESGITPGFRAFCSTQHYGMRNGITGGERHPDVASSTSSRTVWREAGQRQAASSLANVSSGGAEAGIAFATRIWSRSVAPPGRAWSGSTA